MHIHTNKQRPILYAKYTKTQLYTYRQILATQRTLTDTISHTSTVSSVYQLETEGASELSVLNGRNCCSSITSSRCLSTILECLRLVSVCHVTVGAAPTRGYPGGRGTWGRGSPAPRAEESSRQRTWRRTCPDEWGSRRERGTSDRRLPILSLNNTHHRFLLSEGPPFPSHSVMNASLPLVRRSSAPLSRVPSEQRGSEGVSVLSATGRGRRPLRYSCPTRGAQTRACSFSLSFFSILAYCYTFFFSFIHGNAQGCDGLTWMTNDLILSFFL